VSCSKTQKNRFKLNIELCDFFRMHKIFNYSSRQKNKFKLNIELCDFLGPIKYLIIVHKELFADVSRIGLCDDDYDEISLLIFLHDNHHR
jgi:hypothetical protein